jgi:hypothetical protein
MADPSQGDQVNIAITFVLLLALVHNRYVLYLFVERSGSGRFQRGMLSGFPVCHFSHSVAIRNGGTFQGAASLYAAAERVEVRSD